MERRDERGTVMILAVVGVVIAMIACALAVDLGRLAADKRNDQKIADLAALDAARDLSSSAIACSRAQVSATRNGYPTLTCSDVVLGTVIGGVFTPGVTNDAVQVNVRSAFSNAFPFVGGPTSVAGKGTAKIKTEAGFSIGSSLANFSSADNVVLNKIFGGLFHNPGAVNMGLVTYQGLATSTITLGALATQLGFGSVDTLMTSSVTLGQLLSATATVLNSSDTVLAAQVSNLATLVASGTSSFKLGDFMTVQQGSGVAASTGVNVLDLIEASAQIANKNNFVNVGTTLNLPVTGVGSVSTKLGLTVVEPAKTYIGPVGGFVKTAQVTELLTPSLVAAPLGALTATGDVPVTMTAAGATGTLTSVSCTSPQGIAVSVAAQPVATAVGTTLAISLAGLAVANVTVGPASANSASATNSVSFSYPTEFTPSANPKSTPAVPPGLTVTGGQVTVTILPGSAVALALSVAGITASVISGLVVTLVNNVISAVSTEVLSPTFAALGLKLGQVDVAALKDAYNPTTCGQPALVN